MAVSSRFVGSLNKSVFLTCIIVRKYAFERVKISELKSTSYVEFQQPISVVLYFELNICLYNLIILMHKYFVLATVLSVACSFSSLNCPYSQFIQFIQKQISIPYQIINNPYQSPTKQYLQKVNQNLKNKQRVCAIKYTNPSKNYYQQKNFQDKQTAINNNYIITHQGICGKCSTTKDLYVYLTTDLTRPVRKCGLKYFYSHKKMKSCIKNLGFTDACTQVWYWNTLYTKKQCFAVCLWAYITNQSFVINGQLNKCLQCDQDKSGPIFKYQSGRTRRNSGIKSQIDRPDDQIYKMDHCYY